MRQPEQHHIPDGLAASDRGDPDHMAQLSRAKGGGMAGIGFGGVIHGASLCFAPGTGRGQRE